MVDVKRADVTLVTTDPLPEPDLDEAPLVAALKEAGLTVRVCPWKDPEVDWSESAVTVVRSTWDYYREIDEFLRWIARTCEVSGLWNPAEVLRWNAHKGYLLSLPLQGVRVVPTVLVKRGQAMSLGGICEAEGWRHVVIKPAISAGSYRTHQVFAEAPREDLFGELVADGDVLVQPYMESVDEYGERSMVFIDGALSHCVRKHPRFAGGEERVTGPEVPTDEEVRVAEKALSTIDAELLYGRVDLVRDGAGKVVVAEVEVMEPSLFFRFAEGSARRFADGVRRRLERL